MKTWTLTEKLGVAWTHELIHLDCTAAEAPVALTDGNATIPCQYDPERKALACFVNLLPGTTLNLRGTSTAAMASADILCSETPGAWILKNSEAAFHLARKPAIADHGDTWQIDGPLTGWVGPDGVRRGGSRLVLSKSRFFPHDRRSFVRVDPSRLTEEETPPTIETSLEAVGPVFIRYRYALTLADGRHYTWHATLYAKEPLLRVSEAMDTGRDGNLVIDITQGFPADLYVTKGSEPGNPERTIPLPQSAYRLGSLAPHHSQMQTCYPWLGFMQSLHPQGTYRGIGDTEVYSTADVMAMMGDHPWNWEYPAECTYQFNADAKGIITATGAVRRGRRAWFLFVEHRRNIDCPPKFQVDNEAWTVSCFAVWHRRLNDLPLDWVRRCELDEGDAPATTGVSAMLTAEEWQEKKAKVLPLLAAKLKKQMAKCAFTRWAITGDRDAARTLYQGASALFERKFQIALASGFLSDQQCPVMNRGLGPAAIGYQVAVAEGVMSPAEHTRLKRLILFFAHATAEDALFPSHHNYRRPDDPRATRNWTLAENYSTVFGTPNFQTDVYYNLALFGAVFQNHPRSKTWLADVTQQLSDQLDAHFNVDGVYIESIGYFGHLFHNMLHLASVLRRHGERDFYADPRFQKAMNCFVDYLCAPRQQTLEQQSRPEFVYNPKAHLRHMPAIGDTGGNCCEVHLPVLVAHAATEVRRHNPALSGRLLAAWNACGNPVAGDWGPYCEFLYLDGPDAVAPPLELASRRFLNVGVMLRADVGQPSETSLFLRSGRATHHWGFEQGHWTLTTRGSLLVPDYGYYGTETPGGRKVSGYHTWLHNIVTFGEWDHGGMGPELRRPEKVVSLGEDFDYIVMDLSQAYGIDSFWRNIAPVPTILYERHFLFAHNRYVLVWDRIEHSTCRSQLRVGALAKDVAIDGSVLRFTGLDDVNLVVHMLEPGAVEFNEGIVGPQRYVMCEQDCQRDYLWVSQPVGPGESEFTVRRDERMVTVSGTDLHGRAFADHILYATDDHGAEAIIDGVPWRLDGRFAVHHREEGHTGVAVLNAERFDHTR